MLAAVAIRCIRLQRSLGRSADQRMTLGGMLRAIAAIAGVVPGWPATMSAPHFALS